MQALCFDGQLELREVETPRPGPGEALIRVTLAGVCGTDREILKGYSGFQGILGHEFVGKVVECEEKKWVGKRVVGEINVSCGECDLCLWGLGRHCPKRTVVGIVNRNGTFAEYLTLPVINLHEVPASLPDEAAVFVEPVAAAAEVIERIRPFTPASRVAVLGDGRLGMLIGQVLRHVKARVTLVGKHSWKLALARSWGMRIVQRGEDKLEPASFNMVVEATGSPGGLEEALHLVAPRGTVVMKSTFRDRVQFDTAKVVVDEITLLGSRCGDFSVAIRLLNDGHVKVQPMISKTFPLDAGLEAISFLDDPHCMKVLLAPSAKG